MKEEHVLKLKEMYDELETYPILSKEWQRKLKEIARFKSKLASYQHMPPWQKPQSGE